MDLYIYHLSSDLSDSNNETSLIAPKALADMLSMYISFDK